MGKKTSKSVQKKQKQRKINKRRVKNGSGSGLGMSRKKITKKNQPRKDKVQKLLNARLAHSNKRKEGDSESSASEANDRHASTDADSEQIRGKYAGGDFERAVLERRSSSEDDEDDGRLGPSSKTSYKKAANISKRNPNLKKLKRKDVKRDDVDGALMGRKHEAQQEDEDEGGEDAYGEEVKKLACVDLQKIPGSQHAQFGTKLSHTEKHVRDAGFKKLQKWLVKKADTLAPLEFVKLWEAMFYAMWMADKRPVQQNLAAQMAMLTRSVAVLKLPDWFASFFEVMVSHWSKLDIWRMNKFQLLVRIQIAEMFCALKAQEFDEDLIEVLNEKLLSVAPFAPDGNFNPGFAQHAIACFWDELMPCLEQKLEEDDGGINTGKTIGKNKNKKGKKKAFVSAPSVTTGAEDGLSSSSSSASLDPNTAHDRVLHLLEPYFQILTDGTFPDAVHRSVVKEILGAKLPAKMRKGCADELFDIGKEPELNLAARKRIMSCVEQLEKGQEEVVLPPRKQKFNKKLEAPQKRLRRGLGVRTRGQRKIRECI